MCALKLWCFHYARSPKQIKSTNAKSKLVLFVEELAYTLSIFILPVAVSPEEPSTRIYVQIAVELPLLYVHEPT